MPAEAVPTAVAPVAPTVCLNCGRALTGPYCSGCGQKAQSLRQPLRVFAAESFTEYWGFDGRLWRSFRDLVFRPGKLTVDFVEGRRTAALRPFRLYLTATLLFFVTLGLVRTDSSTAGPSSTSVAVAEDVPTVLPPSYPADSLLRVADAADALDAWAVEAAEQRRALTLAGGLLGRTDSAAARSAARGADSLHAATLRFARLRDSVLALRGTSTLRAGSVGLGSGDQVSRHDDSDDLDVSLVSGDLVRQMPDWLKGDIARRLERARTPAEKDAALEAALDALVGQIPTAMFFVLPLFAVLLKLLYARGGGIELRARRLSSPPSGATPGAGLVARAWASARGGVWSAGRSLERRQVRRRIRSARRPWRRELRALRARLPARFRAGRFGWLRRAATSRRTRFYAEHVVFTLHVHAFAFVVFWALLLVDVGPVPGAVAGWLVLSVPAYFLLSQRRVYAQTWGKTLAKSALLGTAYTVVLTFGTLLAGALAARLG